MQTQIPSNLNVAPTQTSKRSTFNLPDNTHQAIEILAKGLRISMKDLFSDLVAHISPGLTPIENQSPRSRKTYVITSDTLKKINIYTRVNSINRDDLIVSLVYKAIERLKEIDKKLSVEEKIRASKRIQECAQKALDEWDKCGEERGLLEKYDASFAFVAEYCGYIDQLNELPFYIDKYINKILEAHNETDEACS